MEKRALHKDIPELFKIDQILFKLLKDKNVINTISKAMESYIKIGYKLREYK